MNPLLKPEYLLLITLVLAAAGALFVWSTTAKCGRPLRILMIAMRVLAVACLGVIAFNIGRYRYERYEKESEWAVLVDRSVSMATQDVDGKARWNEAVRLSQAIKAAAGAAAKTRLYTFADQLETPAETDIGKLKSDGPTTDIIQAGKGVLARYRSGDKKLAGIFLVSDGRQVGPARQADLSLDCRSQESPIYVLPVGGEVERKDLSVTAGRRQYVAFVGQKLKIGATVRNEGLGNISTDISLTDAAGGVLGKQKVEATNGANVLVQFDVTPEKKGYYEYFVKAPAWEGEDVENNNAAPISVVVLQDKMRIFVAEGTPGWDSKFLLQLLRKQANMEVTSVYRLSSERFFKVETDVSKASEAGEAVFPDSAEKLAMYDIIMMGKGADYFLNPARIRLVADFVRDQGGCLFFYRGKPYSASLPELESLEPVAWGEPVGSPFRFQPARAGEYAGLFGDVLAGPEDEVWKRLPSLQAATRCSNLKAFSQVLVEGVYDSSGRDAGFPLLVSRRFGKGMIMVMNAEGLWQWDFFPSVSEASRVYKEMWAQLLQWGVTYSEFLPGQEYSLKISESSVLPDTPVSVRISKRGAVDKKAVPSLRVLADKDVIQEMPAVPVTDADNRWTAAVSLSKPGTYRVELAVASGGGPCAMVQVRNPPTEKDNLSADRVFLQKLAEESGGAALAEDQIADLLKPVEKVVDPNDTSKAVWVPSWDKWWFSCGLLLCFTVEWFVRRRNGLL